MEKLHWLWPTLVYETSLCVDDLEQFNAKLLSTIIDIQKDPTVQLWDVDTPEVLRVKQAFGEATNAWFHNAGLDGKFEQEVNYGWLNIYQPGQYIPPHHHQNLELISLYYITDEDLDVQFRTVPVHDQMYEAENTPASTVVMDPRGAFEFRESNPYVEFEPRQGRILTMPGHLIHWTVPSTKLRAVIVSNPRFHRRG